MQLERMASGLRRVVGAGGGWWMQGSSLGLGARQQDAERSVEGKA